MSKILAVFLFSLTFESFLAFKIESVDFKVPPREPEARSSNGRISNGKQVDPLNNPRT